MFYAFFLFWPANVISMWMIVIILQLFIPLNLLLRLCCIKMKHYKIHVFAAMLILVSVVISLLNLIGKVNSFLYSKGYTLHLTYFTISDK